MAAREKEVRSDEGAERGFGVSGLESDSFVPNSLEECLIKEDYLDLVNPAERKECILMMLTKIASTVSIPTMKQNSVKYAALFQLKP